MPCPGEWGPFSGSHHSSQNGSRKRDKRNANRTRETKRVVSNPQRSESSTCCFLSCSAPSLLPSRPFVVHLVVFILISVSIVSPPSVTLSWPILHLFLTFSWPFLHLFFTFSPHFSPRFPHFVAQGVFDFFSSSLSPPPPPSCAEERVGVSSSLPARGQGSVRGSLWTDPHSRKLWNALYRQANTYV